MIDMTNRGIASDFCVLANMNGLGYYIDFHKQPVPWLYATYDKK